MLWTLFKKRWLMGISLMTVFVVLLITLNTRGIEAQEPRGEESIEVHLLLIPFHVITPDGKPVIDLTPDEVKISIDGKDVPVTYLDRYHYTPEVTVVERWQGEGSNSRALKMTPISRNIYVLIDTYFSQRRAFFHARTLLKALAPYFSDLDVVYFLTMHPHKGIRFIAGPFEGGERVFRYVTEELKPSAYFLAVRQQQSPESYPFQRKEPLMTMDDLLFDASRPVDMLIALAHYLGSVPGPKMFIWVSQGFALGNPAFDLVRRKYKEAWEAFSSAGVSVVLLNPLRHEDSLIQPESATNTLSDFEDMSGGYYLRQGEPSRLGRETAGLLMAYYEASVRIPSDRLRDGFQRVKVKVNRKDVRVIALSGFRYYRRITDIPIDQLRYLIIRFLVTGDHSGFLDSVTEANPEMLGMDRKGRDGRNLDRGPKILACWRAINREGRVEGLKIQKIVEGDEEIAEPTGPCLLISENRRGYWINRN